MSDPSKTLVPCRIVLAPSAPGADDATGAAVDVCEKLSPSMLSVSINLGPLVGLVVELSICRRFEKAGILNFEWWGYASRGIASAYNSNASGSGKRILSIYRCLSTNPGPHSTQGRSALNGMCR